MRFFRQDGGSVKLGLVINPMAGIGGAVGLKGSDGLDIVEQALDRGARPHAQERALAALNWFRDHEPGPVSTAAGSMGQDVLEQAGIDCEIVYTPGSEHTTADDTFNAVVALCEGSIDLLMFAGGDGTARDVLNALRQQGQEEKLTVVGIPAGCKIHSAVYAVSPRQAGELVAGLLSGQLYSVKSAEVMDLDEDAFRAGQVRASCYGYMNVPVDEQRMQAMKQGGVDVESMVLQDIAADFIDNMQADVLYLVGSGTTTAALMEELGLDNTLLGIDAIFNGELIAGDLGEQEILGLLDDEHFTSVKIVVTVIGGQGHVFGRGNQQFSPAVIRRVGSDNIIIVATRNKLRSLDGRPLRVDTGDVELDTALRGMKQIITGYDQRTLYKID
ncbi:MAG: ATP-NAD kinase family protein [Thiotrichales bacterium]|nr:MAG: ATP-NAD kinase family protein [Thiotrichales bacterium]